MADNEIKLKLTIDNKEAIASIILTDENIQKLYKSFKYGKQEVNGLVTSISQGFNNAREIIQGFREAFGVLTQAFTTHLKAYQEQEVALVKLNTALKQTGQFTADNVKTLTNYAAELQETTIYGDDLTETVMAQLLAMGLSVEQTKQATLQAANLAAVMGTDLNTAARAMADLFNGNTGMIGRYVKGLDEAIIKSGDLDKIIKMLNERIGGQAEAMGKSSVGQIARMNNAIGDLKENTGELLSKVFSPLINMIADFIGKLNQLSPTLSGFIGTIAALTTALITLNVTGISAIIKNIITGFIPAINSLKISLSTLQLSLGPVGWLTLGLSTIAGLWFSISEGQQKATETLKIYNEQYRKLRLEEINKELSENNINATRKFLLEQERKGLLSEMLISPHTVTKQVITKSKSEEELKKEFELASKKLTIEQEHQENLLKIETDNELILLELQKKHLEEKKNLYIKYGQDTTEINYRIQEIEKKIQKDIIDERKENLNEIMQIELDKDIELKDAIYGNMLEYIRLNKEQELELWYNAELQKIKYYENFNEMKLALDEEYKTRKKELDDEIAAKSLEVYSNLFGALSQLFGKHTAAYKLFAIAQTIIDTYQAAQAAYKSMAGIPIVGPTLAAIASATAIIQGMARVKAIQETKIPGYAEGGAIIGEKGPEIITPAKDYAKGFAEVALMTKEAILQSSNQFDYNIIIEKLDKWHNELIFRIDGMDLVTAVDKNKLRKNRLKY